LNLDYYRTRRTLSEPVEIEGIGLHTGQEITLRICPAGTGGLVFVRVDREPEVAIPARAEFIVDSHRNTTLGKDETSIRTVEHLLSAFYGLGITDARIELDGGEIPAVDGSARPFVEALDQVGFDELDENRSVHRVEENTVVTIGESSLILAPAPEPKIDYTISYDNPAIGDQFSSVPVDPETFRESVAPARTYGFKEEVEELLDEDLAQGGSLENALIVDEDGNFVGDEPRISKEFVHHKILDLMGDLALSGGFIAGQVIGLMGSHELNASLLEELQIDAPSGTSDPSKGDSVASSMPLDVEEIKDVLPHRYPFLLVDRIISIDYEEATAVGFKNVTINEEYFQGHFPEDPVMPGVLVIEAMAQLGAACILRKPKYEGKNSYFMGLDDVKWRKPVRPGDRLYFEIEGQRMRSRYGLVEGKAFVDGELAAEGLYKFAIVDR
jgi:UDP-3-O-[3-hydroxymyristoyl] N-acetylglucosamine deacetylase/3-hydroxyacyl-[acyl-carrier-protein] dehydratase